MKPNILITIESDSRICVPTFYTLQIITTIKLFKVLHKMYLAWEGYIVACTKSLAMNESA